MLVGDLQKTGLGEWDDGVTVVVIVDGVGDAIDEGHKLLKHFNIWFWSGHGVGLRLNFYDDEATIAGRIFAQIMRRHMQL